MTAARTAVRSSSRLPLDAPVRTRRVALYARLSEDRDGTSTATERQLADSRALAESRGWDVVATYIDNDLSAFDRKVVRPAYEDILGGLRAGAFEAVVVWKMDRLIRQSRELEPFLDLLEATGSTVVSVNDHIDTEHVSGRMALRFTVGMAQAESENTSLRSKRKALELAQRGRAPSGVRRFGTEPVRDASGAPVRPYTLRLVESEAAEIRAAAAKLLAGASLHSIELDWDQRGVRTPSGNAWHATGIRKMLSWPRIAGLRSYYGEIVATETDIPAILDRATWDRLVAVLTPRRGPVARPGRTYLLTGLLRCGKCDGRLTGRTTTTAKRVYACVKPDGCGGLTMLADTLEAWIAAKVLETLDGPRLSELLAEKAAGSTIETDVADLHADEAAMAELAEDHYVARVISRAEFFAARAALEARIAETRKRIDLASRGHVLAGLVGYKLPAVWERWDIGRRRALVEAVVERITIAPVGKKGPRVFNPGRVAVAWRE